MRWGAGWEEDSHEIMTMKSSKCLQLPSALCAALWLVASLASAQSPPALSVQWSNGCAWLNLEADIGAACTIQYCASLLPTNNWRFLTNLTPLLNSPHSVSDAEAALAPRFYRAFSQQVPTNVATADAVWIAPGSFIMGSPPTEAQRGADETQHAVTLTHGFYIGKHEVTQAEYLALMGHNPSFFTGDLNRPVDTVSWNDATDYCAQLTQRKQAAGRLPAGWGYRLPTESEWEHACRAGTATAFNFGSAIQGGMANFYNYYEYDAAVGEIYISDPAIPYLGRTTAVGTYEPNAWGLYDMHGNVWEWCQDWYGAYPAGSVVDPQGPASGSQRVARGGCCGNGARCCRSAYRFCGSPADAYNDFGFRTVLAPIQ